MKYSLMHNHLNFRLAEFVYKFKIIFLKVIAKTATRSYYMTYVNGLYESLSDTNITQPQAFWQGTICMNLTAHAFGGFVHAFEDLEYRARGDLQNKITGNAKLVVVIE
jgi:hypothetical protein